MSRAEGTNPATAGRRVLALLRCCSIRFAAYYWLGFAAGLAAVGRLDLTRALLGVPLWLAHCIGTEAVNRLADRDADVLNRPERTLLCEEFGWRALTAVAWGSWLGFAGIGAVLLVIDPGPAFAVLLAADLAISLGYSLGPAFKRRRAVALVVMTAPVVMPLLTGWSVGGGTAELRSPVLPAAAVLAAFSLGLAGIKDITDVEGDRAIGYSSLWVTLIRLRHGLAVHALIGAPFVLAVAFVLAGALPVQALALLPGVVISATVVTTASRASEQADLSAARELMHQYTFYFLACALLAAVPTAPVCVAVAVAVGYWLAASQTLHWSGGLSMQGLRRCAALLAVPHRPKEFS